MHWYEDLRAAQKERMRQARWALEFDSKFVGMNSWIPFFFWKRSSGMCVFVFLLTCKMLVGTVSVFSWWRQKPKILGTVEPFCWKKWATHPGDEWQPKWQDLSRCLSWSSSDASTTIWKGRELNRCEKQLVFCFDTNCACSFWSFETRNLCQNPLKMLKISFLLLNLMSYLIGSRLGTQVMRQVRSNPDFGQFVGAGAMGGWWYSATELYHVFLHFLESQDQVESRAAWN